MSFSICLCFRPLLFPVRRTASTSIKVDGGLFVTKTLTQETRTAPHCECPCSWTVCAMFCDLRFMSNATSSLSFIYVLAYVCPLTDEMFPKMKSFFESEREAEGSVICRKGPRRMFCVAYFLPTRHRSVMLNCLVDTIAIAALLQLRFCEDSFCINNWSSFFLCFLLVCHPLKHGFHQRRRFRTGQYCLLR